MFLKCFNCGHIFDECEGEVRGADYERFMVCPCCGSDEIEESIRCDKCGGEFLKDELIAGLYCEECLKDALTFDSFREFAEECDEGMNDSDVHMIEHFMMVWMYGVDDVDFTGSSREFRELMTEEFNKSVEAHERAAKFGDDDGFLDHIRHYIEDYNLRDDFAEYLYAKEVKE